MRLRRDRRRIDDDDLVSVDETDRATTRTEEPGCLHDQRVRDVRRRQGGGERGRELLERLNLSSRLLGGDDRRGGPLLRPTHHEADPDHHQGDAERDTPAQEVVAGM